MVSFSHFIIGSAVGKASGNPLLAAFLGIICHFLADMIPHWDLGYKFKKDFTSFFLAFLDLFLGFAVVAFVFFYRSFDWQTGANILLGGFFGILPDLILLGAKIFKINFFKKYINFHSSLHWFVKEERPVFEFKQLETSFRIIFFGILWQAPFVLASLYFLWR